MAKKRTPDDTPTPFERELRRAMVACEQIAGDTDTPIKDRVHALQRVVTFWQALIDELDPKRRPMDAAAD